MSSQFFRLFILIICIFATFPLQSQVKESFSDGEFLTNPVWTGDTDKFIVRQYDTDYYLLDLNDLQKGNAMLSTPSTSLRNTEWKFHFQLNGKTRNKSSCARFYLTADSPDLRGEIKGYFVDFGSMDGLIALVRQDGPPEDTTVLIHSRAQMTLSNTSNLEMRITCSSEGEWNLYADVGNGTYSKWGSATDKMHETSGYIGVYCIYTKTNCTNFSFGMISVIPLKEDNDEEGKNGENTPEEENKPDEPGKEPPGEEAEKPGEKEEEKEFPDEEEENSASAGTGFFLENRSFTPDGDGINDEMILSYNLPEEGYEVQLTIYNASGRKIRTQERVFLRNNVANFASSELKWDGKGEDGETVSAGLYILLLEATHPVASEIKTKQVIALTY